jgi:uncharacterized protein (TIGR03086 family)
MTAGPLSPLSQLSLAVDVTGSVISAVADGQWDSPTPCPGWSVRDLVSHVVTGNRGFTAAVGGQPAAVSEDDSRADGGLPGAYSDSAEAMLDAFGQPGVLEKIVTVPFGSVPGIAALHLRITELLVHGWDLARATGQAVAFPEDLAEQTLAFSVSKLPDVPPDRRPFGPPQPVPDDAPAIDRLAARLGRPVTS